MRNMQKISFTTSTSGTVEADDVNISSLNGERIFRLSDFDGNSVKARIDAVQCIGMPGQRTFSAVSDVKTIMMKLAFAPVYLRNNRFVCTGAAGMHTLRREVLRRFPIGETGTLDYTNSTGTYTIQARVDEVPTVTMQDGYLCECTIYLTADYPYWCKPVTSEIVTVSGGTHIFSPPEYGDIPSPVSGWIRCSERFISTAEICFSLINTDDNTKRIDFDNLLLEGDFLRFNFRYNNEWYVKVNGYRRSDFVYFSEYSEPCINIPDQSSFRFEMNGTGVFEIQLIYNNLFIAV